MEGSHTPGPVFARSEVDVAASPRQVWAVLADIEGWPTWNPAVRSASLDGDLEMATSFRWAAGPGTNACVLRAVDAPRTLAWSGRSMGIGHRQSWTLEPHADGCHVTTEQAMTGWLARLFVGRLQQRLQNDLDTWVQLLKLEAEERASEEIDEDADVGHSAAQPQLAQPPPRQPPPRGGATA